MPKVKFIDKSRYTRCWICLGIGYLKSKKRTKSGKVLGKKCSTCNGTGEYRTSSYILVATNTKKQKIAFSVDNIK